MMQCLGVLRFISRCVIGRNFTWDYLMQGLFLLFRLDDRLLYIYREVFEIFEGDLKLVTEGKSCFK